MFVSRGPADGVSCTPSAGFGIRLAAQVRADWKTLLSHIVFKSC
jgi:hypothetical protein